MDRPRAPWWVACVALLLLAACGGERSIRGSDDDDVVEDDDDTVVDDDDTVVNDDDAVDDDDIGFDIDLDDIVYLDDDDSSADDDDVVDDDDTTGLTFDCSTAPSTAGTETIIPGAAGYHGLAIDAAGLIVGSDGWSLIRSDYNGNWSVWIPNIGSVEQMTYLPGGHLVYASGDTGDIHRISPAGGQSVLATGLSAYGVVYGPDGRLWTAGWNGTVDRIDLTTGLVTTIATIYSNTPHSIGFNLDDTVLYIGTTGDGTFYQQALDANFDPVGAPTPWLTLGGGWHDAVAVDICGYIYVPDYWSSNLWRIDPTTGVATIFANWNSPYGYYGHGAIWGTGVGGWLEDALYVPMPYGNNQVREIPVGVPGRDWAGTAINLP